MAKTLMVRDRIHAHKMTELREIMDSWIIPAVREQIPGFSSRHFSTVIGDILEFYVLAEVEDEHILDYDRWIIDALVRAYGQEEVDERLPAFYACVERSTYTVLEEW